MSLCADRNGRCDIPSSFPDGPGEGYWEKSSQLISWRAGPAPGWPRILSLLPLLHTRGICSSVWSPGFQAFGGEVMLHLHPAVFLSLTICKPSVLGPALRSVLLF